MPASWIPKIIYGSGPTTYTFPNPPSGDPFNEALAADTDEMDSNTGTHQCQYNFTRKNFSITYTFLASSDITSLRTWFDNCAKLGLTFNYYPSNELGTYFTMFLAKKEFNPVRMFADGAGDFVYQITFVFQLNYT